MNGWLRAWWSRLVSGLAITAVAAVAGVISYSHMYRLTLALHQTPMVARLMPFSVDGLIVVGSVVLLQAGGWLGWTATAPGVALSLFANVESGLRFGWLAAAWAGVPAASFFLSMFVLERWLAGQARTAPEGVPDALTNGYGAPEGGREAAERFASELAAGTVPSVRAIRREVHLGQPKAERVQSYLAALAGSNGSA